MTTNAAESLGKAFGYLSPNEIVLMKKYAEMVGKQYYRPVIVNIGAGAGTSGLAFREAAPNAAIFTVDISLGGPLGGMEGERNAFRDAGLKLPFQLLGDSKEVGMAWATPVHLLFIDGDHTKEGLEGDMDAWLSEVVNGGYVLFHDYGSRHWPDVKDVLDTFFLERKDYILKETADTLVACKHNFYEISDGVESGKGNKNRKK